MKILIPKKTYLFLIFFFILLSLPVVSSAALKLNLEYPSFTVGGETFDLNTTQHLNQVVVWFYYFIVAVAGFSAFVMLVWGGVEWLVSAGNPTKTSSAKERITSAVTGLLIILVSFLILQTINPELTTLTFPETREAAPWPKPPDDGSSPEPGPGPEPTPQPGTCAALGGKCCGDGYVPQAGTLIPGATDCPDKCAQTGGIGNLPWCEPESQTCAALGGKCCGDGYVPQAGTLIPGSTDCPDKCAQTGGIGNLPWCEPQPGPTKCDEVGGFGDDDCMSTEECNNFGMICDELGPFECPECCCRPL